MQKIDRLLSMIIYLLNHKRVSASYLARHYEVTLRTIQRDIDTLTLAGIPIIAYTGVYGGYELMEEYRMHVQLANRKDYEIVRLALEGLQTAFDNSQIAETVEKVQSLSKTSTASMLLDFRVLKEKEANNIHITVLERAIKDRNMISFCYHNAKSELSKKTIEPLTVLYKWYAWYLIGYDCEKESYRYYKILRMEDLQILKEHGCKQHPSIKEILHKMDLEDHREYYDIVVQCDRDCLLRCAEYLNGVIIKTEANGDYLMKFHLPKDEELWKGTLLAYSASITIVEPKEVKDLLKERCVAFLERNSDIELS